MEVAIVSAAYGLVTYQRGCVKILQNPALYALYDKQHSIPSTSEYTLIVDKIYKSPSVVRALRSTVFPENQWTMQRVAYLLQLSVSIGKPEQGSIKSAQYPATRIVSHILRANCMKTLSSLSFSSSILSPVATRSSRARWFVGIAKNSQLSSLISSKGKLVSGKTWWNSLCSWMLRT